MSLQVAQGNFSRDTDNHLWAGNESVAIGLMGTSRDAYGAVRTIVYATSGGAGLIARFNEFSNGSRQYYQFIVNPDNDYACVEEVNVSTNWSSPTLMQSRAYTSGANESMFIGLTCTAVNASQDRLQGFINDLAVIDYTGSLSVSSGKFGVMAVVGITRFDRNLVVGDEVDVYCSVQDVSNLLKGLGITPVTDEGEILGLIAKASHKINNKTDSVFGRLIKVVEERHRGGGEESVIVDHTPLKILTQIKLYNYNNALVNTLTEADDNLIVEEDTGLITMPAKSVTLTPIYGVGIYPIEGRDQYTYKNYDYSQYFGVGRRNIIIDYLYGNDDVPHSIWDACRKMVAIELLVKLGNYTTQGAVALRLGDASEDYRSRSNEFGNIPFSGTISKWQRDIDKAIGEYDVLTVESV